MTNFVLNAWYMVAWADELTAVPLARRLLDMPIVLFRTAAGQAAALINRCPHRFAPLSRGQVQGEMIRCGYHGLAFSTAGKCVDSPFGLTVPPGAEVRSFPVVERDACLWLWPGQPELADPRSIPDFGYHVDPAYRVVKGYSAVRAHFEVITDNLMDLTHTRYLHPAFGGDDWVPQVGFSQEEETLYAHYTIAQYPPSPFSEGYLPANGRQIRETDYIRWNAPASMYLHIELQLADGPEDAGALQPSSHILCPETATTTHYFWASGAERDAPITDQEHVEAMKFAFDLEDAPMLEAVQEGMEGQDFWDLRPAILAYDAAGVRARRLMRRKLHAEQRGDTPALPEDLASAIPVS